MPPRSCRAPPRSRGRRPVNLESRLGTQRLGQVSQLTWRGIGSERPRMPPRSCRAPPRSRERRPVDLESRLGTQRPGQASQLTSRGIGSERPRMPPRSCCAPPRGRERRPVDLDFRESPARLRGSWRSSAVSTRAHQNSEAVTAAGRDTTRVRTGARTATRRRWRLSGLDHMKRPARLRGSRRSREASVKAGRVAAGERSTR